MVLKGKVGVMKSEGRSRISSSLSYLTGEKKIRTYPRKTRSCLISKMLNTLSKRELEELKKILSKKVMEK